MSGGAQNRFDGQQWREELIASAQKKRSLSGRRQSDTSILMRNISIRPPSMSRSALKSSVPEKSATPSARKSAARLLRR